MGASELGAGMGAGALSVIAVLRVFDKYFPSRNGNGNGNTSGHKVPCEPLTALTTEVIGQGKMLAALDEHRGSTDKWLERVEGKLDRVLEQK